MTDAMGHTLNAALLATVLVGALRNARRRGVELDEQAALAHAALSDHAKDDEFVTGQLVRIDLPTGTARIVNAGHPAPFRLRDGHVEQVTLESDLPFGAVPSETFRVQELSLRAGDRLLFLTDGMLEHNVTSLDPMTILRETRHLHPREAVQDLTRRVVEGCGGELRDDATVLCLDWHGGPPRLRQASEGADDREGSS